MSLTTRTAASAAVVLAATGIVAASAAPTFAAAHPKTAIATEQFVNDVAAGLATSTDLGATDPDQPITVSLALSRPDAAGEAAFTAALYDPKSPSYHQFLTPDSFAARFGVSDANYQTALAYGTAHGLTLLSANPSHDLLRFTGTVTQAESTFGVSIHNFHAAQANPYLKSDYFSNTTGPMLPAGIGAIGVIGLSDERVAKVDTSGALHAVRPDQSSCTAGICMGLTTPQDLWSIYDQPDADKGQGTQLAIFGEGQSDDIISDLRTFEAEHSLRRMPVTVVHTDGASADYSDDAGAEEWNIDTQSSTGMAPLADREVLYFGAALTDDSVLGVFDTWVNDSTGPMQASASYGECEEIPDGGTGSASAVSAGAAYTLSSEQDLSAAVAMGKTLFSSSGDTGAGCPVLPTSTNGAAPQAVPQPNYPADSPSAVSVGGTVLYSTGASPNVRSREYSWNYTGGGTSFIFPEPAYQKAVGTTINGTCVGKPGGGTATPGTTCRGVPDVAMQSGDIATNGYGITVKGVNDQAGGGTSLASPLWEGIWARIQSAAANKAGFANYQFYKVGTDTTKDPDAFFDIGGLSNNQPGATMVNSSFGEYTNLPRNAVTDPSGWDYLSGFGTPDVSKLMLDVANTTAPYTTVVTPDAPLPTSSGGAPIDPACIPAYTDSTGDDAFVGDPAGGGSNPQLDIVKGDLHYLSVGGVPTLQTIMTLSNLSTNIASAGGAANLYYSLWSYTPPATTAAPTPAATTYFTEAEVDSATKAITYSYGTYASNRFTSGGSATGSFNTGPLGTVVVNVPLASVGISAPQPTTQLVSPAGQTRVLVGSTATGGLVEQADAGADNSQTFTLGERCAATGLPGTSGGAATATPSLPESPYAVLLPLVALSLGGGAFALRRARRVQRA